MTSDFRLELKTRLAPLLRAEGFAGSGVTFRRQTGVVIQVLTAQGSNYGDSCCVNLGTHLTFLPTTLDEPSDPKNITESLCEFRRRMAPEGQSDRWWNYGSDRREASAAVEDLVGLTRRMALPFFERFRDFPAAFEGVTPELIASGDFSLLPGGVTAVRGALAMARIAAHLGQASRARDFARVGVACLGSGPLTAVGIARELAALAEDREGA